MAAAESARNVHIKEFLQTQQKYVDTLRSLFVDVIGPLIDSGVSQKKLDDMFGVHKLLLGKHQLFLTKFQQAVTQDSEGTLLGTVLSDHFRDLRLFTDVINREEEIRNEFDLLKKSGHQIGKEQSRRVTQAVIGPMQIATRYPLLMKDIMKASKKEGATDLKFLERAKRVLDETVETLNEAKRSYDNKNRIKAIQRQMDKPDLLPEIRTGKLLCKEGFLFSKFIPYIFALKGTSLRKFANDKDYNNNDPVEEYSMAKSQVHTKIEGGNYPCKIIVETPDTKIVLYTDDHTVMNDWVQAFGKVKHLDEENLASQYRVLYHETDCLFMKRQEGNVFQKYRLFLFNDCLIIAAEGGPNIANFRHENLGIVKQGSFRTRRKTTTRGHRDTIGSVAVSSRRNTAAAHVNRASVAAVDGYQHLETLFFFENMDVSQSKFNAEYLIHIKYTFSDDLEKEYVLAFRDGSMQEREDKWDQWFHHLERAKKKFQSMMNLSSHESNAVQEYYGKIVRSADRLPRRMVANLEQLHNLLLETINRIKPQLEDSEVAVKKDVDEIITILDKLTPLDQDSDEYFKLYDTLLEKEKQLEAVFNTQLTGFMRDIAIITEKESEVAHIRGGTIFRLL